MKYYVYKVTNQLNGKFYIGKRKHKSPQTDNYMGSGAQIKAAISKYGKDNFKKEILAEFSSNDDAALYEKSLVTTDLIADPLTYNMHEGGHGGFGHVNVVPPEQRVNIISLKKKISSGEISVGGTKDWNNTSYEKVRRQAEINRQSGTGINSPESIEKRKKTMFAREHQRGEKNSQFGKKWFVEENASDLTARKMFRQPPTGWITTTEWKELRKDKSNNAYGAMWINDGKENRLIHKNESIPNNWKRGRLMNMIVRN